MALVTTILIDRVNATASCTITQSGNPVETISFASNQITFAGRSAINITGAEFLDYINQINIFQTALRFNFENSLPLTTPFNSINVTEQHDTPNNNWNLVCIYGATPRVCSYSALGANSTVDFAARANSKTIEFPEWLYLLFNFNHYQNSVKKFFSL